MRHFKPGDLLRLFSAPVDIPGMTDAEAVSRFSAWCLVLRVNHNTSYNSTDGEVHKMDVLRLGDNQHFKNIKWTSVESYLKPFHGKLIRDGEEIKSNGR